MFKYVLASLFAMSMFVIACTKSNETQAQTKHEKSLFYVAAVEMNGDTSYTPGMFARTETMGIAIAEDDKLLVQLLRFEKSGSVGTYTVQVTNKTSCQKILRWNWESINPTSIIPTDTTGGIAQYDVLKANQTKIYTIIGKAVPGKIKVKGEKSNNDCPNSSTLIIDITMEILPIKWVKYSAEYNEQNKSTLVTVDMEDPSTTDYFLLLKQVGDKKELMARQNCDKVKKHWTFLIWDEDAR